MTQEKERIGRLAMRHEGDWWNAYYAQNDGMDGAILLGSMSIGMASVPEFKERFMSLMRDAVSLLIRDSLGVTPEWGGAHGAPENERAGHG